MAAELGKISWRLRGERLFNTRGLEEKGRLFFLYPSPRYTDVTGLAFGRNASCSNVMGRFQEGWSFKAVK